MTDAQDSEQMRYLLGFLDGAGKVDLLSFLDYCNEDGSALSEAALLKICDWYAAERPVRALNAWRALNRNAPVPVRRHAFSDDERAARS
eukprot:SAG11_NODE_17678_length_511_cov_1.973301_1_plen_88_part_10